MASEDHRRLSVCRACAAPTNATGLCPACAEAFAVAARANPDAVSLRPIEVGPDEPQSSDDIDLWDAWSLVGEGGSRPERSFAE